MLSVLDPLMDFRCPHCGVSLRFRRVPRLSSPDALAPNAVHVCSLCNGNLIERQHPAIANNWLWSRFYLPGVILSAIGIFFPSLGWLLPFALGALAFGFLALVTYMVRERWGWKRYVASQCEAHLLPASMHSLLRTKC